MAQENDIGIFCKKDSTFYYMEYGDASLSKNVVERILKVLTIRGLIDVDSVDDLDRPISQYQIMTLKEAATKSLTMKPIYISSNVREAVEAKEQKTTEGKKRWGKSAG